MNFLFLVQRHPPPLPTPPTPPPSVTGEKMRLGLPPSSVLSFQNRPWPESRPPRGQGALQVAAVSPGAGSPRASCSRRGPAALALAGVQGLLLSGCGYCSSWHPSSGIQLSFRPHERPLTTRHSLGLIVPVHSPTFIGRIPPRPQAWRRVHMCSDPVFPEQ